MGDVLKNFSSVMQLVLQSEELLVEDVVHPTFRGDSLPLPTGGKRYEGYANISGSFDHARTYVCCRLKVLWLSVCMHRIRGHVHISSVFTVTPKIMYIFTIQLIAPYPLGELPMYLYMQYLDLLNNLLHVYEQTRLSPHMRNYYIIIWVYIKNRSNSYVLMYVAYQYTIKS